MDTNFIFTVTSQHLAPKRLNQKLKDVILPAKVFVEDDRWAIWGYFTSYTPGIPERDLLWEVKKYGLKRLANHDCDYLLFIWNKETRKLTVGLDNTMNFSCYFAVLGDQLVFASRFPDIKDIVARCQRLVADLDGLLTYITPGWHATEKTLLEAVKWVPPGSKVEFSFSPKITYRIQSLVDVDAFFSGLARDKFANDEEFARALEKTLTDAVARRLAKIPPGSHFGCELSSGFDCTLIAYIMAKLIGPENFYCYSFYFPEKYGTESLAIIKKFANRHHLRLRAVKLLPRQGYRQDYLHLWKDNDLLQLDADYFGGYIRFLRRYAPRLLFTGQHGDEMYSLPELALMAKYSRQMSYFDNVRWLKEEQQAVLYTPRALKLLLDWERFNRRGYYPLFVSDMNVVETALVNEIYMGFGTRQVSPYLDSQVLALGMRRRARRRGQPGEEKQIYARYLRHIFIPEMFIPKKGGTEFALDFPRYQKPLIAWVMKHSVLAQYDLIDPKKIMALMADEASPLYKNAFIALAFEYLIRADWYLIRNRISLPI